MRKLKPISDDAFEFINEVISSTNKRSEKETNKFREKCSSIVSNNENVIKLYDKNYYENTLEKLDGIGQLYGDEKKDFKKLYSPNNIKISKLKYDVLNQDGYYKSKCPLCECDSANTIDHYLPQDKYTLFVVHPRNLIPCCNTCNNHKKERVYDSGKRRYWNCYLDEPIKNRYLKCTIKKIDENNICAEFSLDLSKLSTDEAFLIKNTMEELKILSRYNDAAFDEIENVVKNISNNMYHNSNFEKSLQITKTTVLSHDVLNNWKDVLIEALFDSELFMKYAKNESGKMLTMTAI